MSVGIYVCADDPTIESGSVDAIRIESLCRHPDRLREHATGADRAVVVLHEASADKAAVQKVLRSIDIDPLGAQILEVPDDAGDVSRLIGGLAARAAAFLGSDPENAKPVFPRTMTRRALLRPPLPEYLAAPSVDPDVCEAANGCRACVDVCPQEAYRWQAGRIYYNKDICEPCGRCVTACPAGAITNPAVAPAMLEAQIHALVGDGSERANIRFVCSRRLLRTPVDGWYDVEVPCTGMVPGVWLVATLLLGAGGVAIVPCSESGCPLGLDNSARQALDFAYQALEEVDGGKNSTLDDVGIRVAGLKRRDLVDPFSTGQAAQIMLSLFETAEKETVLSHPGSNLGVVSIDPEACTLCTQCSQTCPTGALGHGYEGETVSLTFDPTLCVNCGQCLLVCPERDAGAIRLEARVDTVLLKSGRRPLYEGTVLRCERCGKPIAPLKMMDRIGDLLGEEFTGAMKHLTSRCVDCRGL